MASRYWVGGIGAQSWANTANWSATLGGTGGASVPATGDSVYILSGRSSIEQGMDQSAVDLALLHIGFQGSIGTSTTPLQIGLQASGSSLYEVLRIWGNNVSVYMAPTVTGTAPLTQIFGNSGQVTFTSGSTLKGFIFAAESGTLSIADSAGSSGFSLTTMGATIIVGSGISSISTVSVHSGYVECASSTSNILVYEGTIALSGTSAHASITSYTGGTVDYRSSGTIDAAFAYGGTFTAANTNVPFTVTSSAQFVIGSLFVNPPVTVTYTNPTIKYGFA